MGENNPGGVLFQRMQQLAFPWHNYGNPIIGQRADIEKVPIDKLQAFYRTWYQPDNAVLIVAGRFDEAQALALVGEALRRRSRKPDARAARALHRRADAGRRAPRDACERVGDNQIVVRALPRARGQPPRLPGDRRAGAASSATCPPAACTARSCRRASPAATWGAERGMHDPGYVYFGALRSGATATLGAARDKLLEVVEGLKKEPLSAAEVERARTALLNDFEKVAARRRRPGALALRVHRHRRLAPVLPLPRPAAQGDARRRAARRRALPQARQPRARRVRAHRRSPTAPRSRRRPTCRRRSPATRAATACAWARPSTLRRRTSRSASATKQLSNGIRAGAAAEADARRRAWSPASRCTGATRRA